MIGVSGTIVGRRELQLQRSSGCQLRTCSADLIAGSVKYFLRRVQVSGALSFFEEAAGRTPELLGSDEFGSMLGGSLP